MNVYNLLRDNIKDLIPYSTARNDFQDVADIYLDANENNYPFDFHRYPDPYQKELKQEVALWKEIDISNIFIGHGSDEIIDLVIRAFCNPGKDAVLALEPTYGMYKVSAAINDVNYKRFNLDKTFDFDADELINYFKPEDKILFLCSPNNPTGNAFERLKLEKVISAFSGIVVLDEAYIDFSDESSFILELDKFPNLIVMQTLSKSMAAASLRIGFGFMSPILVNILNKIKPPYNISGIAMQAAFERVKYRQVILKTVQEIIDNRMEFTLWLRSLSFVEEIFPSEANFILVRVDNAVKVYNYLVENGVVVRDRSGQYNCEQCLRISIGTTDEMNRVKQILDKY